MATNLYPWVRSLGGAIKPLIMPGKVQAGATAAIKRGEICSFNETTGYFIPVNAVADGQYSLAIANEEQKSGDLERYIEFMMMRDDDVFSFPLAAAASVALGTGYTLTASDSQKLTASTTGLQVARSVGRGNYPTTGTSIESVDSAEVGFYPEVRYYHKNIAFSTTTHPEGACENHGLHSETRRSWRGDHQ